MNSSALEAADFVADDRVRLHDRRLVHIRKHLKPGIGDRLRVGLLEDFEPEQPAGAGLGYGEVLALEREAVELRVELGERPPQPSPLTLALALPRPATLDKVLQQGTAMGIKRFLLFHSRRVEKSYWSASALAPAALRRQLVLGLEQCVDTVVPRVELHRRFRPFVEDRLGELRGEQAIYVGDPGASEPCPDAVEGPATLVLGPEGGWVPFERDRFAQLGDRMISLGPRVLRVETAVVALLARMGPRA